MRTRARNSSAALDLPPVSATSLVTRHDHHNIEIKTVCEIGATPSVVETDLFIFVPRSFEVTEFSKQELARDFRSRIRLALPVVGEQGAAAFESSLAVLKASLERLVEATDTGVPVFDLSHPLSEEVLEASKDLCSVVSGTLKHASSEHVRKFFLSQSVWTTSDACLEGVRDLAVNIRGTHDMIIRVREIATSEASWNHSIFAILDEYVSQIYVQYLSAIRVEVSRFDRPKEVDRKAYEAAHSELEIMLSNFQEEEAKHRRKTGASPAGKESDREREQRLVRLSHLKKFFQSKTFVDVTRHQPAKRVSEPMAAVATAAAAAAAAVLERFSRPEIGDVAMHSVLVIAVGVIFYVLRDRLKDRAKQHLQQRALQFLPEFEQELLANDRKIGSVKEWFRICAAKDLPETITRLRQAVSINEMENRLPEDILHCRKIQEVDVSLYSNKPGAQAGNSSFARALHENTRVNFERYLKHMDDPFKEFTDLDSRGRFRQSRSHRVYHFYLCVHTVSKPKNGSWSARLRANQPTQVTAACHEQSLIYRVVLDKNGVVRLEDLAR